MENSSTPKKNESVDFTKFWRKNYRRIVIRCMRYVNQYDAEDLAMEVWFKCKSKKPDSIKNWWSFISTVCRNISINWFNKATKERDLVIKHQQTYNDPDLSAREKINKLFASKELSERQMDIWDNFMDGKKQTEIAEVLGISVSTVQREMRKAKRIARNFFERLKKL